MKAIYLDRKSFAKYDEGRYILYLNEETIEEYVPETHEGEEEAQPCTAYSYEGTEAGGGTVITAENASYDDFVAGLVRLKYSQNQVEAILCNHSGGEERYVSEYNQLQEYRKECKQKAAEVLSRK